MPTRLRKTRRLKGSRTMGWGQVGQHRKSGGRGGRGKAGLMKHKWTWTVKYAPDHFGKDRFKPPTSREARRWLNVGQLDALSAAFKGRRKGKAVAELNLAGMGYDKLLGAGEVKGSYKILVGSCSGAAKEKVEKAGGKVVVGSGK